MRYISTILFFCLSVLITFSSEPVWLDSEVRDDRWNPDLFYTATSFVQYREKEDASSAAERAVADVKAELASKIKSNITVSTKSTSESIATDKGISESDRFSKEYNILSGLELTNLQTDTYVDDKNKTAYAFAYVKKSDVFDFYAAKAERAIVQAEILYDEAKGLISSGEKIRANVPCGKALDKLKDITEYIDILNAIKASSQTTAEMSEKSDSLSRSIKETLSKNIQSTKVFITVSEKINGKPVSIINGKISESLSNNDCEIVSSKEDADYIVEITSEIRKSSVMDGITYVFADVETKLIRRNTDKTIYTGSHSYKGGGSSEERAARKALGQAASKIAPVIISKIN